MNIDQTSLQYANEMYQQLGEKIFKMMTGAVISPLANIAVSENQKSIASLFIALPSDTPNDFIYNKNKISMVFMHLMSSNTYTFEFIRKGEEKSFKTIHDVYCDEVQDTFELNTGLIVTPHKRKHSKVVVGVNV
ncbi:MAG: hypothetical protein K2P99_02160 [Burkholderiales bacterium]|nr:hypothetical protein [Burkholderiales bacterium]